MKKFTKCIISFIMLIAILFSSAIPNTASTDMHTDNISTIGIVVEAASGLYPITARTIKSSGRVTTYTSYETMYIRDEDDYYLNHDCEIRMRYFGESVSRSGVYGAKGYKLINSDGYISCNTDTIYILNVIDNTIAFVKYPVPGGYKERYVYLKDILVQGIASRANRYTCKVKTTVYKYSTGSSTFGSVFVNDEVIYIGTCNGRVQLLYPISGGYKSGYCPQDQWYARFSRNG